VRAQVGNTPGVTKSVQEVHLDKHIKLLDSPGVVFADASSDAAAALRNAIKASGRLVRPATAHLRFARSAHTRVHDGL
jgi:nuclear GTP-binding protein